MLWQNFHIPSRTLGSPGRRWWPLLDRRCTESVGAGVPMVVAQTSTAEGRGIGDKDRDLHNTAYEEKSIGWSPSELLLTHGKRGRDKAVGHLLAGLDCHPTNPLPGGSWPQPPRRVQKGSTLPSGQIGECGGGSEPLVQAKWRFSIQPTWRGKERTQFGEYLGRGVPYFGRPTAQQEQPNAMVAY